MFETDDIQHILPARAPALDGRYEFLSFRSAVGGRAWLAAILEKVQSAAAMEATVKKENRWVTVAFTWSGLRALGVDEASLATFPEEFRQGMVARAEMLGDTGENHPDRWVGGLASPWLVPCDECELVGQTSKLRLPNAAVFGRTVDKDEVSPKFGLAWSLSGRSMLRLAAMHTVRPRSG
jgi:hypothetical protein